MDNAPIRRLILSAGFLVAVLCAPALAQDAGEVDPETQAEEALEESERAAPEAGSLGEAESELDALFTQLKRERSPNQAKRIVRDIWAEWGHSDSATVDLLMQWANEAMRDHRHATALDLLDQVIVLEPDFAEGWNRRATLHFMIGNHAKSMSDINRVLQLEPRHFGALSGMAAILSAAGNDELALRAYRRVLDIYPADRAAQEKVIELVEDLSGDPV